MSEHDTDHLTRPEISRRLALKSCASGFGYLAFASLMHQTASTVAGADRAGHGLASQPTHFPARAKRVIFLCMNGGPSHVDLFDYKPALNRQSGKTASLSRQPGQARLMGSPFRFSQAGESGLWFSEVFPELAGQADQLCMIHSMHTDLPNHSQAFAQMHTGSFQFARPSIGAWTLYGLGTENQNLPGFITVNPPAGNGGARNYASGFLPAICQGTRIGGIQIPPLYAALLGKDREPGPPIRNISNRELSQVQQREQLDLIRSLNRRKLQRDIHHPEIEGAIESFELAFRMQDKVPQLLDIGSETRSTMNAYGLGAGLPTDRFARQCLLARRLAEAGVRFIEITAPSKWDHHFLIKTELAKSGSETDQPVAALLTDLRQRGMLQDTLVVWPGEFGRTPYAQSGSGRDHNNHGYTLWMAGGGVKGGMSYGATDEHGHKAVENPVHIQDWHATLLHLLGLDHERLTFNYAGREFRLTDVHGQVVRDILI
ncbi:MAG: DUF1501 domain-containing protein [Planctomycetaceae bacterium]